MPKDTSKNGKPALVRTWRGLVVPEEAIREVLLRIASRSDLQANHQVALIALRPDGHWSSGALRPGFRMAFSDGSGHHTIDHLQSPLLIGPSGREG